MPPVTNDFNIKKLTRSFCIFIFAYGLLMVPWPGLGATYSKFFRSSAAFLFDPFVLKNCSVHFNAAQHPQGDILIVFYDLSRAGSNGDRQPLKSFCISSRYYAYIYSAFVFALILATPLSLKRKAWALLWGISLLHCFLFFKMGVMILHVFSHAPSAPIALGPFWMKIVFFVQQGFLQHMVFGFMASVFIWIFIVFCLVDEWDMLIQRKK